MGDFIDLNAAGLENREKIRLQVREQGRAQGMEFIGISTHLYLELVHVETGSFIIAELEDVQSFDPSFINATYQEMENQLRETMTKAIKEGKIV